MLYKLPSKSVGRAVVGILLVMALLLLLYDMFGLSPITNFIFRESQTDEIGIGSFKKTSETSSERQLKVQLVSISKSYRGDSIKIEIKNADSVAGTVTVRLKCNSIEKTVDLSPGQTETVGFYGLEAGCSEYEIIPDTIK